MGTLGSGDPSPFLFREPQIAEVEASFAATQAALGQSLYDLERTRLCVPFSGRVWSNQVDASQFDQRWATLTTLYTVDVSAGKRSAIPPGCDFCPRTANAIAELQNTYAREGFPSFAPGASYVRARRNRGNPGASRDPRASHLTLRGASSTGWNPGADSSSAT
ncbi:MAG: hypothetical protein F4041_09040 [Acidobacteriia bacterium]|nr:hypothetical protein [Terriglobia bacterium]